MMQKEKVGVNQISDENLGDVNGGKLSDLSNLNMSATRFHVNGPNGEHYGPLKNKSDADAEAAKHGEGYYVVTVY